MCHYIHIVKLFIFRYREQEFMVRWGNSLLMTFHCSNGIRQGGQLSPLLYNVYTDDLNHHLQATGVGCNVRGAWVNSVSWYDMVLLAHTVTALQALLEVCGTYAGHNLILGVASKQLRLLHGQVGDFTTVENSLSPQMSELVEDAIAFWRGDIVGHFWLVRNGVEKLVELKFEFLSFNPFDVSQIFWQRVIQPMPKYSYCILLKGLCWISVCWIMNNALCSMPWMFSGFYCVPNCAINIWRHLLCYLPNIYNYITFMASLERVQFEFVQSFPVV